HALRVLTVDLERRGDHRQHPIFGFGPDAHRHGVTAAGAGAWNRHEPGMDEGETLVRFQRPGTETGDLVVLGDAFDAFAGIEAVVHLDIHVADLGGLDVIAAAAV